MSDKKKQVDKIKKQADKKWFEAFPHMIAFLFFMAGMVMNLFTSIIHDSITRLNAPIIYNIYTLIVSLLFICFFFGIYFVINKLFVKPYEDLTKKIEKLERKFSHP